MWGKYIVHPLLMVGLLNMQLIRQLQGGQDENPFGDETLTSPKKIFQLLNQVSFWNESLV